MGTWAVYSPKGVAAWTPTRANGHGGPFLPAKARASHALGKSGNGAPFSLVRFFWTSKRNEHIMGSRMLTPDRPG